MKTLNHVVTFVQKTPWALYPPKLREIVEVVRLKASGANIAPYAAADRPQPSRNNAVAVLPIFGLISQRANMMTDFSGGTSTEQFTKAFRQVMADPEIGSIILEVDSPGGSVFGVPELAAEILKARNQKPIVAVANSFAASAAYWLIASASEIVVSPSGEVGSIGVYAVHEDFSKQNEMLGVNPTYISAGKYKVEATPDQPLSDEARAHIQESVDRYFGMFTSAVAKGRGVKQADVINGFGQGRMIGAAEAVKLGMADRVATLDQTIVRLASGNPGIGKVAAIEHTTLAAVLDGEIDPKEVHYRDTVQATEFTQVLSLRPNFEDADAGLDDEDRRRRLRMF